MAISKDTEITYSNIDGEFTLLADGEVVGTIDISAKVNVRVGQGRSVHAGRGFKGVATVGFATGGGKYPVRTYAVGDVVAWFNVRPICGAVAAYKTGGYANGWVGANKYTDEEVTCKKCVKLAA